jgi:hypothetical protein
MMTEIGPEGVSKQGISSDNPKHTSCYVFFQQVKAALVKDTKIKCVQKHAAEQFCTVLRSSGDENSMSDPGIMIDL